MHELWTNSSNETNLQSSEACVRVQQWSESKTGDMNGIKAMPPPKLAKESTLQIIKAKQPNFERKPL